MSDKALTSSASEDGTLLHQVSHVDRLPPERIRGAVKSREFLRTQDSMRGMRMRALTVNKTGYRSKNGGLSAKEVALLLLRGKTLFFYSLIVSNCRLVN